MLALAATNASVLPLAYLNPYAPAISLSQGLAGFYAHPNVWAHHAPLAYSAYHAPLAYSTQTLVATPAAGTLVAAPAPALLTSSVVAAPSA